jgi:alkanesulfonate monooxygenase SsuD/methylene tetrahydromethanopterin reductase-like flavin-dependent oxidoreductase (luciferase family)
VCGTVKGRFLSERTVPALRGATEQAGTDGLDAVFLTDGPLGDPIVLAAALSAWTSDMLVGIRVDLSTHPHRHPTLLGREMTTLDLVTGGRAVLAFMPPFTEAVAEAITLCRGMWRDGIVASDGPHYPVAGAINRPRPLRPDGPPIALDLTEGVAVEPAVLALADLALVRAGVDPAPVDQSGIDVWQIQHG